MTKLVVMSDNSWIALKIKSLIFSESEFLRKAIRNISDKIGNFEKKYGTSDRESLYGQADDMELLEWEGEIETAKKLQAKLKTLKGRFRSNGFRNLSACNENERSAILRI